MSKRKLRILSIAPVVATTGRYGGMPLAAYYQAKHLNQLGHEIYLLTTYSKGVMRIQGIREPTIPELLTRHGLILSPTSYANLMLKSGAINDYFDIVHMHDARDLLSCSLLLSKKRNSNWNVPIIIQTHGSLFLGSKLTTLKKTYDIVFLRRLVDAVDCWIATTYDEVLSILTLGVDRGKITIIPNGVDEEAIWRYNKSYRYNSSRDVVLYLGRIHKSKNVELLIKVMRHLANLNRRVTLIIAGYDEGEWHRLARLIRKLSLERNVKYVGFVSEETKYRLISTAKVVAIPKFHCTALTVLEALALNKQVITTRESDRLDEKLEKLITRVDNSPENMAKAIENALDNTRSENSIIGYMFENYSWKSIAEKLEKLYFKILNKS